MDTSIEHFQSLIQLIYLVDTTVKTLLLKDCLWLDMKNLPSLGWRTKEYLNDAKLRRYNPYTYENETDNYWQYHYHLNITQKLNEKYFQCYSLLY